MGSTIAEDGEQLSILNPQPVRLAGPSLLHQLVNTSPPDHKLALEHRYADGTISRREYRELHQAADTLAAVISEKLSNKEPQDQLVIPVIIPQCPQLYISLLAILKAGGAFCPINLDAPRDRIGFILGDVKARLILTSAELAPSVSGFDDVEVLIVEDGVLQGLAGEQPMRTPSAQDLAYVMYTSGSTGTPKGVGISHDAATQALLAHDRHIPEFRRFLQFAAPTFDVSVFEIFFPLFRGATLVSCSRAEMLDDLPAVLKEMHVDACELTPTVAGSLLRTRENAPDLRLLLTIGEMLTQPVVQEFGGNSHRPSVLWAMYGPTEATIHW